MRDKLSLSPTPVGEDCAQLGEEGYRTKAKRECKAWIGQLRREFGEPPPGTSFRVALNPHDFGTYLDVEIAFDDEDEESVEYAYRVEGNLPEFWDEVALSELGAK